MVGIPKPYTGGSVFNYFLFKTKYSAVTYYQFFKSINLYLERHWENFILATCT
jgi:hypothetical protein